MELNLNKKNDYLQKLLTLNILVMNSINFNPFLQISKILFLKTANLLFIPSLSYLEGGFDWFSKLFVDEFVA